MAIIALAVRPDKELVTSTSDPESDAGNARAEPERAGRTDADGTEPDVRFTLANERTFLAWSRTALALIAAGLAVAQLLPPFPHVPWGRSAIATPLILLGAALSPLSYVEWRRTQRAIRQGAPSPPSRLPKMLAATVGIIALLAAAVDLYSKVTRR